METKSSSSRIILPVLIIAGLTILLLALWQQYSKLTLSPPSKHVRNRPAPDAAATPSSNSPAPAQLASDITGPLPAAESGASGRLTLTVSGVTSLTNGLAATFRLSTSASKPQTPLILVVRLSKTGTARILNLTPADSMKYSGVNKRVSTNGRFAVFQGTPEALTSVLFRLEVSGPATADIRGTCGLEPLQLDIQPSGAGIVRP